MAYKHTEETKENIRQIKLSGETYKRPCIFCGKIFGGGSGLARSQKFCSRKCYWDSNYHKNFMIKHPNSGQAKKGQRRVEYLKKICPVCKNIFETIPSNHKKCCSKECYYKRISSFLKGKPKSVEHNKNVSLALKKHFDKVGRKIHKRSYHSFDKKYIDWRKSVFEKDNYTCQVCGKIGGIIFPHHIRLWSIYPELRYNINNGITVCKTCHKWCHHSRKN